MAFCSSSSRISRASHSDVSRCNRSSPSNGGFNSLERLDHERALFFSTPFSLGQRKMRLEVQDASATPCKGFVSGTAAGTTAYKDVPCVENRRWSHRGVTYVTLNIQGSCNNLCDTAPDPVEKTTEKRSSSDSSATQLAASGPSMMRYSRRSTPRAFSTGAVTR